MATASRAARPADAPPESARTASSVTTHPPVEVAIIGGGLCGTLAAAELTGRDGARVVVLEASPRATPLGGVWATAANGHSHLQAAACLYEWDAPPGQPRLAKREGGRGGGWGRRAARRALARVDAPAVAAAIATFSAGAGVPALTRYGATVTAVTEGGPGGGFWVEWEEAAAAEEVGAGGGGATKKRGGAAATSTHRLAADSVLVASGLLGRQLSPADRGLPPGLEAGGTFRGRVTYGGRVGGVDCAAGDPAAVGGKVKKRGGGKENKKKGDGDGKTNRDARPPPRPAATGRARARALSPVSQTSPNGLSLLPPIPALPPSLPILYFVWSPQRVVVLGSGAFGLEAAEAAVAAGAASVTILCRPGRDRWVAPFSRQLALAAAASCPLLASAPCLRRPVAAALNAWLRALHASCGLACVAPDPAGPLLFTGQCHDGWFRLARAGKVRVVAGEVGAVTAGGVVVVGVDADTAAAAAPPRHGPAPAAPAPTSLVLPADVVVLALGCALNARPTFLAGLGVGEGGEAINKEVAGGAPPGQEGLGLDHLHAYSFFGRRPRLGLMCDWVWFNVPHGPKQLSERERERKQKGKARKTRIHALIFFRLPSVPRPSLFSLLSLSPKGSSRASGPPWPPGGQGPKRRPPSPARSPPPPLPGARASPWRVGQRPGSRPGRPRARPWPPRPPRPSPAAAGRPPRPPGRPGMRWACRRASPSSPRAGWSGAGSWRTRGWRRGRTGGGWTGSQSRELCMTCMICGFLFFSSPLLPPSFLINISSFHTRLLSFPPFLFTPPPPCWRRRRQR